MDTGGVSKRWPVCAPDGGAVPGLSGDALAGGVGVTGRDGMALSLRLGFGGWRTGLDSEPGATWAGLGEIG